jgi:hypothetical protein
MRKLTPVTTSNMSDESGSMTIENPMVADEAEIQSNKLM